LEPSNKAVFFFSEFGEHWTKNYSFPSSTTKS